MTDDDAVRATNDDASSCKLSAVQRGYWKDPYVQYFIRSSDRKAPEIHRGYYARVQGMKTLLKEFLQKTKCKCQVINLGAGFDTTYWQLYDEGTLPERFVEVDFDGVTSKKCYYVKSKKPLLEKITGDDGEIQCTGNELHTSRYHIINADLRNVTQLHQKLETCGIDYTLPTAFIAECVLVYMTAESSTALLKWIAEKFSSAFFINYEQVNMQDRFGQVMVDNLRCRGCKLAGVEHCASLDTQRKRFLSTGWAGAEAWDMIQVYRTLPQADVQRTTPEYNWLPSLNRLHEMLFTHYCICWAYVDSRDIGLDSISMTARTTKKEIDIINITPTEEENG